MHICPCSWALGISKKTWIQTCFGPVTVEAVEVFRHFAFSRHGFELATCVVEPKDCIFWGASCKQIKIWQLRSRKVTKFSWNPPIQPIANRVALNLEIISKNFLFSTRRTRILMRCTIYYLVLFVNPIGRILVRSKKIQNYLEIQCHPICNRLYHCYTLQSVSRVQV